MSNAYREAPSQTQRIRWEWPLASAGLAVVVTALAVGEIFAVHGAEVEARRARESELETDFRAYDARLHDSEGMCHDEVISVQEGGTVRCSRWDQRITANYGTATFVCTCRSLQDIRWDTQEAQGALEQLRKNAEEARRIEVLSKQPWYQEAVAAYRKASEDQEAAIKKAWEKGWKP